MRGRDGRSVRQTAAAIKNRTIGKDIIYRNGSSIVGMTGQFYILYLLVLVILLIVLPLVFVC